MNKTNVSDWKVRETSEEKQIYPETPLKLTQKIESQGFSAKSRPIRHFLLAKANKTIDRLLDSNGHTLRVFHARAGFKARIACHDLPMLINSTRVIQLMNQQNIIYITKGNERKMIWSKPISTTLELISNKARVNDENLPSRMWFNEGMKVEPIETIAGMVFGQSPKMLAK